MIVLFELQDVSGSSAERQMALSTPGSPTFHPNPAPGFHLSQRAFTAHAFKCVERRGNIYLISYIADHPNAEYSAIRLMGQGIGSHMMSPQLFPHGENVSINSTCDLEGPSGRRQYAFIRRAPPGCKFPRELHSSWNFTYLHARRLDIGLRYIVLVLLNGQRIVFSCETRDSNRYVIRSQGFPSPDKDSFLCVHFKPMEDDPFYDYVFSRLNSGVMMDGMLKVIEKGRPIFMHQDCDWFDSPARPEFLYR
ncbi:hypothetical protein BaRGS_00035131 [Batillaria attramentaria]|uniref:Uncharacterized protein n=1 Tax=Batillaria attramentaria TaxID=370345 RepID=A0ABD0JFM9_9CAEN